jgi:hypothetical protein
MGLPLRGLHAISSGSAARSVVLSCFAHGCGPGLDSEAETDGTSTDGGSSNPVSASASTADTSATTDPIDPTGGPPELACTLDPADTSVPGLTLHARLKCEQNPAELAPQVIRVAPGLDGTYVSVPTDDMPWIVRIVDDELEILDDGLATDGYSSAPQVSLAQDQTGALHYVAVGGRVAATRLDVLDLVDSTWTSTTIHEVDHQGIPLVAHEIGPDAVEHVWFQSAPQTMSELTAQGGEWSTAVVPGNPGNFGSYTLDRWDRPVLLFVEWNDEFQLRAVGADFEGYLGGGAPTLNWWPYYASTHALPTAIDVGPDFAVAWRDADSLVLAWPDGGLAKQAAVPDTPAIVWSCYDYPEPPCQAECVESGSGVEAGGFGTARTAEGRIWIAYLRTDYQKTYTVEENCNVDDGCSCLGVLADDTSTASFHLLRLEDDGTLSETIVVSIPAPAPTQFPGVRRWFDMRAFGSELAVGWLESKTAADGGYRVMRIDTSLLES